MEDCVVREAFSDSSKQWCTVHQKILNPENNYVCPSTVPMRPDRDAGWLLVSKAISVRADCRRRTVGAVIVDAYDRIVSTGRNGSPPGGPSCLAGECPRGLLTREDLPPDSSYDGGIGLCNAVHAEANAIIFGDPSRMRGGTMYVTHRPCTGCQRLIDGMGLKVIFNTLKENHEH